MPNPSGIGREVMGRDLHASFLARLHAASKTTKELIKEHRHEVAKALLSSGLVLIPSEHLQDHQFVVSQGIYDAAKKVKEVDLK